MEWLDVVDEKGNPTGERVERKEAHRRGIRHRTSHVWILREQEGEVQVLLQKRSQGKDSHPGCYDISSACLLYTSRTVTEQKKRFMVLIFRFRLWIRSLIWQFWEPRESGMIIK